MAHHQATPHLFYLIMQEDSEDIENLSTDCSQDGNDDSRGKKGMRSNPQRFYKSPYKFCETFKVCAINNFIQYCESRKKLSEWPRHW